jgi:hypothetical protein
LFLELFGDISGRRSGDFNPSFGENGASEQDEGDVEDTVERVIKEF